MTDFSVQMTELVICPGLHLKEEENNCSQPEGKTHTGGMWPQGRDFGIQTGNWSEVSDSITRVPTAQKKQFESGLIKVKVELDGNKSALFS